MKSNLDDICCICDFNISEGRRDPDSNYQVSMSFQMPNGRWICGECGCYIYNAIAEDARWFGGI